MITKILFALFFSSLTAELDSSKVVIGEPNNYNQTMNAGFYNENGIYEAIVFIYDGNHNKLFEPIACYGDSYAKPAEMQADYDAIMDLFKSGRYLRSDMVAQLADRMFCN
ncbi:MAG: hypothetical protein MHMPM18_002423 [Marteilia pararefringens]